MPVSSRMAESLKCSYPVTYSPSGDGYELKSQSTITFSIKSIQASKSIPKSMNVQLMPSLLYSSCSSTNMWWLKNCCSFSLVKLMQSCSKPLYFYKNRNIGNPK
ncbi:unnamed protein product [Diatraea saccharalis]|uniref:Uncharacterized protein n=1 Tax=Diatraea saccharalis TaxID=40085 RepID=A0A9N9QZI5_9NEOP|nr:unnamed protein product [Diatraea saccharalis]